MNDRLRPSVTLNGSSPFRLSVLPVVVAVIVVFLWVFPEFWYKEIQVTSGFTWFGEATNVAGWTYREVPVGKSAEAVLAADRIANGEFEKPDGSRVGVYSAKRYGRKDSEIGLFAHTPDRCWTVAGWQVEPTDPDFVAVTVHDFPMVFERRLFHYTGHRELVYFTALVGGRGLPFRMDQYYSGARRRTPAAPAADINVWVRMFDKRFWGLAWSSFVNRTPMSGPQQFVRVSTPIEAGDVGAADQRLKTLLPQWMVLTNFNAEAVNSKQKAANSKAEIKKAESGKQKSN